VTCAVVTAGYGGPEGLPSRIAGRGILSKVQDIAGAATSP
jgi:hypothetical protein